MYIWSGPPRKKIKANGGDSVSTGPDSDSDNEDDQDDA